MGQNMEYMDENRAKWAAMGEEYEARMQAEKNKNMNRKANFELSSQSSVSLLSKAEDD